MWETIQSLNVNFISCADRLLFQQKDGIILYDLQGRKILDQYSKPVSSVIGNYFVSNNTLYNADSLSSPVALFTSKFDHIIQYREYWITAKSKMLSLYSAKGDLIHEVKCSKIVSLLSGTSPILISKELHFISVKMNKIHLSDCRLSGVPLHAQNDIVLCKLNDSNLVYYRNAKALQVPFFVQWTSYKQYLFVIMGSDIKIYDCVFGVLIKTIPFDHHIHHFVYNGRFIIAATADAIIFTPVVLSSSNVEIVKMQNNKFQIDLNISPFSVGDDLIQSPGILDCEDYQVPGILACMPSADLLQLFKSLSDGLSNRTLLIIKLLNKQNHEILKNQRKTLLDYLRQESLKCEYAGILKSRIKSLKTLPKIVPPYSIEVVYF